MAKDRQCADSQINVIGVYDFSRDAVLIEVIIDEFPDDIDFAGFCVPDSTNSKSNWQTAYMEQYLDLGGIQRLCETYDLPTERAKPTRLVFFIFKTKGTQLSTPYGDFSIKSLEKLPDRLAKIIDFDPLD